MKLSLDYKTLKAVNEFASTGEVMQYLCGVNVKAGSEDITILVICIIIYLILGSICLLLY